MTKEFYILSLTYLYLQLGVEKEIFKEIMHFHYIIHMATPKNMNPCPWGHTIYNFGRPFLGNHYSSLSLTELCPRSREDFLRHTSKLHFLPKIKFPLGWGGGHEINNFLSLQATDGTVDAKFGKAVLKKMFTNDARRTSHDDGRQLIAIGHRILLTMEHNLLKILVHVNKHESINVIIFQHTLAETLNELF